MSTPAEHKAFIDFVRSQTRFEIGGKFADEGVVRKLASLLGNHANWERFRAKLRDWSKRGGKAYSWGIMIAIAEDAAVERPEPAKQQQLPLNVVSMSEARRVQREMQIVVERLGRAKRL